MRATYTPLLTIEPIPSPTSSISSSQSVIVVDVGSDIGMETPTDVEQLLKDISDLDETPPELTPIRPFLHTNHVPTPDQLTPVQSYTARLESLQSTLKSTLSSLQADLAALEARRTALTTAAKPYTSLTSAFWRFPPELLQVIFVACLPETRGAVMHASEAPLLLGRVCSSWRRIVEHTPEMWSRVHIVPPAVRLGVAGVPVTGTQATWGLNAPAFFPPNQGNQQGDQQDAGQDGGQGGAGAVDGGEPSASTSSQEPSVPIQPPMTPAELNRLSNQRAFERKRDIVRWWLGRSGTCPLDISFVWIWGEGEQELRLCGLLLDVFFSVAHRWRRVEFQVPVRVFEYTGGLVKCEGMRPSNVPRLKQFRIVDNRSKFEDSGAVPWPDCLRFLQSAEGVNGEVEQVALHALFLTFFSGSVMLPTIQWSALRELYLESSVGFFWFREDPDMWDTLEQCVSLEGLTLKFPLSNTFGGVAQMIPGQDGRVSPTMRRVTTMPKLERLCVDGDQSLAGTFHVTRTLAGLRCPKLRSLEIYGRNAIAADTFTDGGEDDDDEAPEDDNDPSDPDGGTAAPTPSSSNTQTRPRSLFISDDGELSVASFVDLGALDASAMKNLHSSDVPDAAFPQPLPLLCAEPLHGIFHLLYQSNRPPLERLALESVTLLAPELIGCLRLVSPTLRELVVRDYTWRTLASIRSMNSRKAKKSVSAEDSFLGALVARPSAASSSSSSTIHKPPTTLCPNLTLFDASLSLLASQSLFCEFVESRYPTPPEGMARLRTVHCAFTAKEEVGPSVGGGVHRRMARLRRGMRTMQDGMGEGGESGWDLDWGDEDGGDGGDEEGGGAGVPPLDVKITFHVPLGDDLVPSPWTGIEGN